MVQLGAMQFESVRIDDLRLDTRLVEDFRRGLEPSLPHVLAGFSVGRYCANDDERLPNAWHTILSNDINSQRTYAALGSHDAR